MLTEPLSQVRAQVNEWLDAYLVVPAGPEKKLIEAMRYAAISTGKAFRPFLVLTIAQMLNVSKAAALRVACALEMVHSYSLIHDDLPCMDNDSLPSWLRSSALMESRSLPLNVAVPSVTSYAG